MMKNLKFFTILMIVSGLMVFMVRSSEAEPMELAFTYQGRLIDGNAPADGLYDFQFNAYDNPDSTKPLATIEDFNDVNVIDGYFTVALDFGSNIYDGNSVWLEIAVRQGELVDPNAYVILSPRQKITPAPFAVYAATAKISPPLHLSGDNYEPIIKGTNGGLGAGVQGETALGSKAGVVGIHTGTGNCGYAGSDLYGIYGQIQIDTHGQAGVYGKDNVSGNYGILGSKNSGVYGFGTGGSYAGYFGGNLYTSGNAEVVGQMTVSSNAIVIGKAGIGTISPDTKLDVSDTVRVQGLHYPAFPTTGKGLELAYRPSDNTGVVQAYDRDIEQWGDLYLGSGNVGIGTTTPAANLEVVGDVKVTGAYYGNLGPNNGGPFPRPAYDSGWLDIAQDQFLILEHNIGGNVDNYVVDLQFKTIAGPNGIHNIGLGIYYYVLETRGAFWRSLSNTSITVERRANDTIIDKIRVRIWVYN